MSSWVSVKEAAEALGVHPKRIRPLLLDGRLRGELRAGRWLVDRDSVEARKRRPHPPGRPMAPANVWKLLALACADDARSLDVRADSEDLARLRRLLRKYASLEAIAPRLVDRAQLREGRVHPGLLPRIRERLVSSGPHAVPESVPDRVVASDELEGYVKASDYEDLRHLVHDNGRPNVRLHVVDDELWPFRPDASEAPLFVAALDLWESDDERSMRLGRELLSSSLAA